MKIKRYFAPDMRQVIRMVRDEQGADAVILSNRRVDGGVEIVAAVDYDEALVSRLSGGQLGRSAPKSEPSHIDTPVAPAAATASSDAIPPSVEQATAKEMKTELPPKIEPTFPSGEALDEALSGAAAQVDEEAYTRPRKKKESQLEWLQDPQLSTMRDEIHELRGILESQLSTLAWGEMKRSHPLRVKLLERLTMLGLNPDLARELADHIDYSKGMVEAWRQALSLFAGRLPVTNDDIINQGGLVALVGPTGVGKTTTIAKLAARFTLRHGANKVALVTTDSYRIGAYQHLRTYGKILRAPVHVAKDGEELREILQSLQDKSLVLIDTAGMSQRDVRLTEQLAMLSQTGADVRIYAVLSASAQRRTQEEVISTFDKVRLDGTILTKIDESCGLGDVLSVIVQTQLPVAYVSDGQRVPEDLHPARANNLVNRSLSFLQEGGESPTEELLAMEFGRRVAN